MPWAPTLSPTGDPLRNPGECSLELPPSQRMGSWRLLSTTSGSPLFVCLSVCLFGATLGSLRDLSSLPGIEPRTMAVKVLSPNHWTAREFPHPPLTEGLPSDVNSPPPLPGGSCLELTCLPLRQAQKGHSSTSLAGRWPHPQR